jgi:hypothetical protein
MNRCEVQGTTHHYEFHVHYADGRTPKLVMRAYREIPIGDRLNESARKIAESLNRESSDGVAVVAVTMLQRKTLWTNEAGSIEACAQCGGVLRPQSEVGSVRVLGHDRDFCSMRCADLWGKTCDCGCTN